MSRNDEQTISIIEMYRGRGIIYYVKFFLNTKTKKHFNVMPEYKHRKKKCQPRTLDIFTMVLRFNCHICTILSHRNIFFFLFNNVLNAENFI